MLGKESVGKVWSGLKMFDLCEMDWNPKSEFS
jgi:hypothetical protein